MAVSTKKKAVKTRIVRNARSALNLPGKVTPVGWVLPKNMTEAEWIEYGARLDRVEVAIQWLRGDWWAYGENRNYGQGRELAQEAGIEYSTICQYGSVCRAFQFCDRSQSLSFTHHLRAMAAPEKDRQKWLKRASKEGWSANDLSVEIQKKKQTRCVTVEVTETNRKIGGVYYPQPDKVHRLYQPAKAADDDEPEQVAELTVDDNDDVEQREYEDAAAIAEAVASIPAVVEASKCEIGPVLAAVMKEEEYPTPDRIRKSMTWLGMFADGMDEICKALDGAGGGQKG